MFNRLLWSLATLALLAGCAQPTPTPAPMVTLTDALGRTVTFPQGAQRVVIAGRSGALVADVAYLFPEAQKRLVAMSLGATNTGQFMPLIDPQFASKTIMEVDVSAEQVAATRPDVVIVKSYMADTLGKPLESLNLPVVYVDLETPEQYQRDLVTLGKVFGNEARGQALSAAYKARIETVTKAVADVPDNQKTRALILYYSSKDGQVAFKVPPLSWLQTMMVQLAGGQPVWADVQTGKGWTQVTLEQIAVWDADQIYVIAYSAKVGTAADTSEIAKALALIKADPQWQALRAVQNGKLYGFAGDYYSWDQPDPRWILGLTWLAGKLHPDRFPGLDMQKEAQAFFKEMYGLDEAFFQKNIQPFLSGDWR